MTMIDRIKEAVYAEIGEKSIRDRTALAMAKENLHIEKQGRYYIVKLFGNTEKVYCNTQYLNRMAWKLTTNNELWRLAKEKIKSEYRKVPAMVQ